MRKRTVLIISVLVINVLIFAGSAQADQTKIRLGYDIPPFTVPGIGIKAWADEVEAKTEGRIDVEIYPSNSLRRVLLKCFEWV
jgi:TRAP-type C4-dicarboxylate transport system substrate-binding protein